MINEFDKFEEIDPYEISIGKRKLKKSLEELTTKKNDLVMSFIIDDFMMDLMLEIYYILKETKIATTSKRQVDSMKFTNKTRVHSMVIGLKWDYYKKQYEIPAYDKKNGNYLFTLIKKLCDYICDKYDLDLKCNTATINKNFRCSRHTDNNNIGSSLTFSLGDFKDGMLEIRNQDTSLIGVYDTKFNPIYFNGSILPHEVTEFEGDRYSVVCYSI
jgi:hypothetical protein